MNAKSLKVIVSGESEGKEVELEETISFDKNVVIKEIDWEQRRYDFTKDYFIAVISESLHNHELLSKKEVGNIMDYSVMVAGQFIEKVKNL